MLLVKNVCILGYNKKLFDKLHNILLSYGECDGQLGCKFPYKSKNDDTWKGWKNIKYGLD